MSEVHPTRHCLLKCAALFGAAAAILWAAWWAWTVALESQWLRTECLVAGIVAGLGATACLAGVMHYLDALAAAQAKWHARWLIALTLRILLLLELATTALALAAAGILIFGFNIPGVHATIS